MDPEIAVWESFLRIAAAAGLGALVGLERESHGQAAGLRTHMIVATGAALMMVVSIEMMGLNPEKADPGRIAAQVVSGMGFLGAGAIIKYGSTIRGLTTAAALWSVAGIGLAAGAGFYAQASLAAVIVLFAMFFMDKFEKAFIRGPLSKTIHVTGKDRPGFVGDVEGVLARARLAIKQIGVEKDLEENKIILTVVASAPRDLDHDTLIKRMSELGDIQQFEIV